MSTIKQLVETDEIVDAYDVMKELRTDLSQEEYLSGYQMMKEEGYMLFALYDSSEDLCALAGVAIRYNFYNKKHLFVLDLVTTPQKRSHGYGEELMGFLETYATDKDCDHIALESGIHRSRAHDFYENTIGLDKFCISFRKSLK
ncbi:GNAT family N-acetyltransferase [Aureibacillus halotolerans]|uniref:Acetyltransferase (GNAT) family protein n=1 Tax=Aureibacillus halotolerans TaxID=1508390 RepID=A0A4V3D5F1_9BACI|nr:GNAT family N-acetyltransferase [Aureibacillus halotolerans]TDQ39817.1 acetyltransferase (GNAT) family protein [Aureibacillus halotolerans]